MTATPIDGARAASAMDLLDGARASLVEAGRADRVRTRYLHSQLAALRAGAAVVALRGHRDDTRGLTSVWDLVPAVAPELGEWSSFFALSTSRRHRVEHGVEHVTPRDADDLLRQSADFVVIVAETLGLPAASAAGVPCAALVGWS